uniref:Uncharacterized protein n=1 Tax=Scleropages formosus TaxID=113540 RepID=A0A8C9SHU6_SCLFO
MAVTQSLSQSKAQNRTANQALLYVLVLRHAFAGAHGSTLQSNYHLINKKLKVPSDRTTRPIQGTGNRSLTRHTGRKAGGGGDTPRTGRQLHLYATGLAGARSVVGPGFESCLGCLAMDWCPVLGVSPPSSSLRPVSSG